MNQLVDKKTQKASSIKILQELNDNVPMNGGEKKTSKRILRSNSRQLIKEVMPFLKNNVSATSNLNFSINLSNKVSWLMPQQSYIDKYKGEEKMPEPLTFKKLNLSELKKRASRQVMVTIESKNHQEKHLPRMQVACICKKTSCKKLYCICFKNGLTCTEFCQCEGCCNKGAPGVQSKRVFLKKVLRKLNKVEPASGGCNCRKSFCTSKYCSCFNEGNGCMISCTCLVCRNILGKRPPVISKRNKELDNPSDHNN